MNLTENMSVDSNQISHGIDTVFLGTVETPMGEFGAVITTKGLARLTFPAEPFSHCEAWARRWEPRATAADDPAALVSLAEQLTAYLEGTLREFSMPVDLRGTAFQVAVWRALLDIPSGEVRSYAWVASTIVKPSAVRAVGAANGANPIPIIVPCHRVIGSDGTLTGYGGGLDLKERLLRLEGVDIGAAQSGRQTRLWG